MNYLAHIFLSGNSRKLQLGNFIGDAVKGSAYKNYPTAIAKGILLHRAIDSYTDCHPSVSETIRTLRPHFGRYSGIVLDIYFDYLLASRFSEFTDISLKRYARRFYLTLISNYRHLPERIKSFMWHLIGTNRLARYATLDGIRDSLKIMINVHRIDISVDKAIDYLSENEVALWNVFLPFFRELQIYCNDYLEVEKVENSNELLTIK